MRTKFSKQTMCSRQNGPHHHRGKIHRIFPTQMSRFLNNTFITHPRWSSAYVLQNGRSAVALFMGQCNLRDQEHQVIKHFYSSEEKCFGGTFNPPTLPGLILKNKFTRIIKQAETNLSYIKAYHIQATLQDSTLGLE